MSSALQARRADETRRRIIEAALELFIAGEPVNMRAVARQAEIGERTIYRYFETYDALATAVRAAIERRAGVGFIDSIDELHPYADRLFAVFEDNEDLIHALTGNPTLTAELAKSRTAWRGRYRALLTAAFPDVSAERVEGAISILRGILSGMGWSHLRLSGVEPAAVRRQAHWAIDLVLGALREPD